MHCLNCSSCCRRSGKYDSRKQSILQAKKVLRDVSDIALDDSVPLPKTKYLPLTFLPDIIVEGILKDSVIELPHQIHSEAVILVCDVCNFTRITETYCQKGVSGIEELASILNGYMSTLSALMLASGGDILNFAGDAFLVLWVMSGNEKQKLEIISKAYHCAVALQAHESLQEKNLDGMLKVKIGMAMGEVSTWVLGSNEFMLFVVAGRGLTVVHHAESMCSAGDIIISKEVYRALESVNANTFAATHLLEGYVRICDCEITNEADLCPVRTERFELSQDRHLAMAKHFLIPSIREVRTAAELNYLSELTLVTILFISLPDIKVEEPQILDETFDIILACAKKQEGAFNKMLLFDKGCTYLVVFGLPGQKHLNDAARALLCAHDIANRHAQINMKVSIGVASGTCFCGLVGHPQRQEYTVIGSRVNLAARLMVVYPEYAITVDADTFHLSRDVLGDACFTELPARKMKGVHSTGKIYSCEITRKKKKKEESSAYLFTYHENEELGPEKESVRDCLTALSNTEERSRALSNTLLPVIIFEGSIGVGKCYFMYSAMVTAMELGYKIVSCCAIPSSVNDPFSTAALLVQRMLLYRWQDSPSQRESRILNALPEGARPHLYLLNHLFHVQFPHPKLLNIDQASRNSETIRLFRSLFNKFSNGSHLAFAIRDADFMDECSWQLIHQLTEEDNYAVILSLHHDFKKPSISASVLFLKAHTHINVSVAATDYYASLCCWFLGVAAVHKGLVGFLKEQTGGDTQLLQEVLLSPTVTQRTVLTPLKRLYENLKMTFFVSEFYSPQDHHTDTVMVCDIKPEVHLTEMNVPPNINDAVQDSLNYLTVQDRLLLKRAALLGTDFDQHLLEAVSPGISSTEVIASINNLMSKNIFCSACSSEIILERIPADVTTQEVNCYHVCFCRKLAEQSIFQNRRLKHCSVGPYQRLRFRNDIFRQLIRSCMTNEQFNTMHVETVNELETNGLICMSCRNKRMENLEKNRLDMRATPVLVNVQQCACLTRRPKLYNRISSLYDPKGAKLLSAHYRRKAAHASNDIGYPLEGLAYAIEAEQILSSLPDSEQLVIKDEEAHFDAVALRASVQKTKAESALLLGNYYYAASFVQCAFNTLGLDTVHFYGIYSVNQFKKILLRLPLLHSEIITRTIGILSECYLRAGKYDLSLMVLKFEFVALSYFPIDFLQILSFMISLNICLGQTKPKKKFRALEKNTLRICRHRLQTHEVILTVVEIRVISKAYYILIQANIHKARLSRAEAITTEALEVLMCLHDKTSIDVLYLNLIEIYLHKNKYSECFPILRKISLIVEGSHRLEISTLYHCAVACVMIKKLDAKGMSKLDTEFIRTCNDFASLWNHDGVRFLKGDLAFYGSTVFALWATKSLEHCNWADADSVFSRCFDMASALQKERGEASYWSVGASITLLSIRMSLPLEEEDSSEFLSSILEELEKLKEIIKTYFPVFHYRYERLKQNIISMMPDKMKDA